MTGRQTGKTCDVGFIQRHIGHRYIQVVDDFVNLGLCNRIVVLKVFKTFCVIHCHNHFESRPCRRVDKNGIRLDRLIGADCLLQNSTLDKRAI